MGSRLARVAMCVQARWQKNRKKIHGAIQTWNSSERFWMEGSDDGS